MKPISATIIVTLLTGCASSTNDLMYKNCREGGASVEECNARISTYDSSSETHTDWGDIGTKVITGAAVAAFVVGEAIAGSNGAGATQNTYTGNCEYSSDTAADGSSCGARSAEARPGGYEPY
jgi:hypothetical protein